MKAKRTLIKFVKISSFKTSKIDQSSKNLKSTYLTTAATTNNVAKSQ